MIHVCPRSHLAAALAASGARHVVSLASPGQALIRKASDRPDGIEAYLSLAFNDIAAAHEGMTAPARHHVEALLTFARDWDRRTPLLIHCYAGISRSTAAAYAVAAALNPSRDEAELARTLRTLSPMATPNALLVALADDLLDRQGRMRAAIAGIGRGCDAFEGAPFSLPVDPS